MADLQTPPPRRKPVLRKELVETVAFGDVVVRQLMLSQLLQLNAPTKESVKPRDGESVEAHRDRLNADWAAFQCKLLELSVIAKGEDDDDPPPLYTAREWDIWQGDRDPKVVDDAMKIADKARAMNGFLLMSGEDPSKNG